MPKASRLKETVKKRTSSWGQMDMPFFMLVVVLVIIGLIMLLSASYPTAIYDIKKITGGDAFYYFKRQAVFAAGGIGVMLFVSRLNYQALKDMTWGVLVLAFVAMALVRVPGVGHYANGAYRWLNYPGPVAALGAGQIRPDPVLCLPPVPKGREEAAGVQQKELFRPIS